MRRLSEGGAKFDLSVNSAALIRFTYLFFLLRLAITEQILLTIKNSSKMPIDVDALVKKKPIEHKTFYIKR